GLFRVVHLELSSGSKTHQFASAASSRVSCAAETSLHPLAFWPAHNGENSLLPRLSALARNGARAAAANGKSGVAGLIGPTSFMTRFRIPRASRPLKTLVKAVWRTASLFYAARCTALVVASGQSKYAVPTCTPAAPRAKAALTPLASAIPPAATTG